MGNSLTFTHTLLPNPDSSRRQRRRHNVPLETSGTAMNTLGESASFKKRKIKRSNKKPETKEEFYSKVISSPAGAELLSCRFGSWCKHQRTVCGFSDQADYTSNRQPLLKLSGSPTRADTTEGRYFQCHFRSKQELAVYEKETLQLLAIHLPQAVSPELTQFMQNTRRNGHRRRSIRTARVVAYHDKFMVVQVNCDQQQPFSKMYILNLKTKTCQGHFVVSHGARRWYEIYISPSTSCLLLRPDVRYQYQATPAFDVQSITWYPPLHGVKVKGIPSTLAQHRFTFNAKLGDEHVIAAAYRSILVLKLEDWSVMTSQNLMLNFSVVRQIRSSPSGDYLAIRYTFPSDGCSENNILILHYPDFTKAMQINVRGAYWPMSDLVNLQVFPRFSLSESCLAVMKQKSYSRRVFVYKLPTIGLPSLQQLCRQAILHLFHPNEVIRLPLPHSLHRYLLEPALANFSG